MPPVYVRIAQSGWIGVQVENGKCSHLKVVKVGPLLLSKKPNKSVGVDIGSHSVKAVLMSRVGGRLRIDQTGYAVVDRAQFNIDPVLAQASALREAIRTFPTIKTVIVGAVPGQTVVPRHPRLRDMPGPELARAIETEAGQNIPYELSEVFLDSTILDRFVEGNQAMVKVLLVAARHEVIESRVQVAQAAELQFSILTVDSLALADAAEGCDFLRVGESVALVNVGATSTNTHFVKDGISNFIRDVNWGAREIIQAICKARKCEYTEGERLLIQAGRAEPPPLPPEPSGTGVRGAPRAERSGGGPAPIAGGSLLEPLEDELGAAAGPVPVPARAVPSTVAADTQRDVAEIMSGPLSRLVAEIRRSFDFYEQQLYEHAVDRMILSGGIAGLPQLREALADELGLERIEVADPTASGLVPGAAGAIQAMVDRPAQFMVAVGLAARGATELL